MAGAPAQPLALCAIGAVAGFMPRLQPPGPLAAAALSASPDAGDSISGSGVRGGIAFRRLTEADLAVAWQCICRGFSPTREPMPLSLDSFQLRIAQNGYRPGISFGAFRGKAMIGCWLSGLRFIDGRLTSYAAGTTVLKRWRQKGIARQLLRLAHAAARDIGAERSVLMVREDNVAARALYKQEGFGTTQTFRSSRMEHGTSTASAHDQRFFVLQGPLERLRDLSPGLDRASPAWTGRWEALESVRDTLVATSVAYGANTLAYGVFQPATNRVLRIGVASAETGVQAIALGALLKSFRPSEAASPLEVHLAPSADYQLAAALEMAGLVQAETQVEMEKKLA